MIITEKISNITQFLDKYKYLIAALAFAGLILFFGKPNISFLNKKTAEKKELEQKIRNYNVEIKRDSILHLELENNPSAVERVARERYYMQKNDEVVYRIEEQ